MSSHYVDDEVTQVTIRPAPQTPPMSGWAPEDPRRPNKTTGPLDTHTSRPNHTQPTQPGDPSLSRQGANRGPVDLSPVVQGYIANDECPFTLCAWHSWRTAYRLAQAFAIALELHDVYAALRMAAKMDDADAGLIPILSGSFFVPWQTEVPVLSQYGNEGVVPSGTLDDDSLPELRELAHAYLETLGE